MPTGANVKTFRSCTGNLCIYCSASVLQEVFTQNGLSEKPHIFSCLNIEIQTQWNCQPGYTARQDTREQHNKKGDSLQLEANLKQNAEGRAGVKYLAPCRRSGSSSYTILSWEEKKKLMKNYNESDRIHMDSEILWAFPAGHDLSAYIIFPCV